MTLFALELYSEMIWYSRPSSEERREILTLMKRKFDKLCMKNTQDIQIKLFNAPNETGEEYDNIEGLVHEFFERLKKR